MSFLLARDAHSQGTQREIPLKITLSSEEPTGVFFDRDTLLPQTPLLFTARIENPSPAPRGVELSWKITDSQGKVRLSRASKFTVEGGDSILRRELFDAPARGGYLLETVAFSRLKGPDSTAKANLPFAVATSPLPGSGVARPQSFFVLSTPTLLSGQQLDFYQRLGARVLRSPLPPDPARPDWGAIEAQLGARLRRNLATIALLPLGDESSRRSQAFFARQVPSTLARYATLTTWELAGDVAPADLDAWSQVSHARRSDISLLGPLPTGLSDGLPSGASVRVNGLEGATFNWPDLEAHPAALRRLWLSRAMATRRAGLGAFHLRRDDEQNELLPADAAAEMTADYLSAIMAGATSMSEKLSPPGSPATQSDGAGAMARGAAFSMLSRTLEDAAFREELFPHSPAYEGALFRAPRGAIAILYATRGSGTMLARLSPARVYDVFGNPLASDKNGLLEIPLSGQPVFVLGEVPTDVLGFAIHNAKISGIKPLEAQFLPLSRVPGTGTGSMAVRVRLQNVGLGEQSGEVQLDAPKGWKLATNRYNFQLDEGESKTYEFRATTSNLNPKWPRDRVPLGLSTSGKTKLSFDAEVPVDSATAVLGGTTPRIDGDLAEWNDAIYQIVPPSRARVGAKVAFKWDNRNLYVAAQVREAALSPRRLDEGVYEFWHGHDALQIAFGTSNGPETVPAPGPFRDSDFGFLLAPFGQNGARDYDGRVLRLWAPDKPFNTLTDRIRWGGVVTGAACAITRDEKAGLTIYEARLPLSALPGIDPRELSARDGAVRFGWVLHNDEGTPLDSGRALGNFPWWDNTATFLPEGILTSSLRSTLGFTPNRETEAVQSDALRSAPTLAPPLKTPLAPVPPVAVPSVIAPAPFKPATPPRPAPPQEIAPFIVPSDEAQPLPPAAPPR
ncbi:hypothetical protein [Abditibacterium utsteinense]|uniref:hypothetical protein n=1 Tax=Abditibacterium utsteinense TaxID=1960156 RepID=UPI000F4A3E0D|nr:hypothetical protein [Abditibacterium utsteinense]